MKRLFRLLPIIMFLSLSTAGMGALGATLCHPIAAVKPTSGSLFLLTDDGTVLAVNLNLTSGAVVGRFKSTMPGYPSDIAYGTVGSQEMLFIGSTWVVGNAVFGSVQAFTTDGRPIRSWATKHTVSGLAFDGTKQMVYFTSGDTPEVYAISPQSNADPRYVGEVPGGQTLGTIAVDSVTQHLYISDLKQGAVFSMDLNTKRIAYVGHAETPQALLIDANHSLLIVADGARGQIVSLAIGVHPAAPHPLTSTRTFRVPSGLAWYDSSHFIVADQQSGSVTLLDAAGRIIYSFVLH